MKVSGLIAYYQSMLDTARVSVDRKRVKSSDVAGLQQAVDVLKSIEAGVMSRAEAVEYVNDEHFNNLPGIAWARKAAKQAQKAR